MGKYNDEKSFCNDKVASLHITKMQKCEYGEQGKHTRENVQACNWIIIAKSNNEEKKKKESTYAQTKGI